MDNASIWPFDYLRGDDPVPSFESLHDKDADIDRSFKVFVLCAQKPEDHPEVLMAAVEHACQVVRDSLPAMAAPTGGSPVSISADLLPGSGAIHGDIWRSIRDRDVIVADLTGENPNVLYELGVAAAIKSARQVILVAKDSPDYRFRFDLQPLRHRFYRGTPIADSEFRQRLVGDLQLAALGLPFSRRPVRRSLKIPHRWTFPKTDSEDLFSPPAAHRAAAAEGLEFGGLGFPYSWLCVGNLELADVMVRIRFRFLQH